MSTGRRVADPTLHEVALAVEAAAMSDVPLADTDWLPGPVRDPL